MLIGLLLISSGFANDLFNYNSRYGSALHTVQFAYAAADENGQAALDDSSALIRTTEFHARPMLMSLVIPGLGQAYNKTWWRAAIFAGIEAAGIVTWWTLTNSAEDKRLEYEEFADEHWSLYDWFYNGNQVSYELYNTFDSTSNVFKGTHQLTIIYQGSYLSSEELYHSSSIDGMTMLRDRDFYENIGKYDQFLGGWDDAYDDDGDPMWEKKEKDVGDSTEYIYMTSNKEDYLDMRYDSNQMLKVAGYAVSAVMFNHVISAIEAVYSSQAANRKEKIHDTSLGLIYDRNSRYGIGGLAVSVRF